VAWPLIAANADLKTATTPPDRDLGKADELLIFVHLALVALDRTVGARLGVAGSLGTVRQNHHEGRGDQ
jgi:hypothetical protein